MSGTEKTFEIDGKMLTYNEVEGIGRIAFQRKVTNLDIFAVYHVAKEIGLVGLEFNAQGYEPDSRDAVREYGSKLSKGIKLF